MKFNNIKPQNTLVDSPLEPISSSEDQNQPTSVSDQDQSTNTPPKSSSLNPWYKKKSTIIAISSTLGAGVLATAIAVPIALTSNTQSVDPTAQAIDALNQKDNKTTQVAFWNEFSAALNAKTTKAVSQNPKAINSDLPQLDEKNLKTFVPTTGFKAIANTDAFVNQLINLVFDNLLVEQTAGNNSITAAELASLKTEFTNATNLAAMKETLVTSAPTSGSALASKGLYLGGTSLTTSLQFSTTDLIIAFSDNADTNTAKSQFVLTIPIAGFDLSVSANNINLTVNPTDNTTTTNNIRLNVFKSSSVTSLQGTKNIYFTPGKTFSFPTSLTTQFGSYFSKQVSNENIARNYVNEVLTYLNTQIKNSAQNSLFWNQFATNYSKDNTAIITADLKKTTANDPSLIKAFLKANGASDADITAFVGITSPKIEAFNLSNLGSNNTIISGSTTGNNADNYELNLNVTKVEFQSTVTSFFNGITNAIKIVPILTLGSGSAFIKTPSTVTTGNPIVTTDLANKTIGVDHIGGFLNLNIAGTVGTNAGFANYVSDYFTSNPLGVTTSKLFTLNNDIAKTQVDFWNTFAGNATNQTAIATEFKTTTGKAQLADFILNNIDFNNPILTKGTSSGIAVFPTNFATNTIESFRTNFSTEIGNNLASSFNSSITRSPVAINLLTSTNGIDIGDKKVTKIDLFFGAEDPQLSSVTKLTTNAVNSTGDNAGIYLSINQSLGKTTGNTLEEDALKRISVQFTIGDATTNATYTFYLGQFIENNSQITKPINFVLGDSTTNKTLVKAYNDAINA